MNKPYTVFQEIGGRRIYVAILYGEADTPEQAIKIANQHFKVSPSKLKVTGGYVRGENLYEELYKYGEGFPVWIVTRK